MRFSVIWLKKNEHDIYLFQYLKFIGAVREGGGL